VAIIVAAVIVFSGIWLALPAAAGLCRAVEHGDSDDMCPVACPRAPHLAISGATLPQRALLDCYVQALDERSTAKMRRVFPAQATATGGEVVSSKTFANSAQARAGVASISVEQNTDDPMSAVSTIRLRSGQRLTVVLQALGSAWTWRIWGDGVSDSPPTGLPGGEVPLGSSGP